MENEEVVVTMKRLLERDPLMLVTATLDSTQVLIDDASSFSIEHKLLDKIIDKRNELVSKVQEGHFAVTELYELRSELDLLGLQFFEFLTTLPDTPYSEFKHPG